MDDGKAKLLPKIVFLVPYISVKPLPARPANACFGWVRRQYGRFDE